MGVHDAGDARRECHVGVDEAVAGEPCISGSNNENSRGRLVQGYVGNSVLRREASERHSVIAQRRSQSSIGGPYPGHAIGRSTIRRALVPCVLEIVGSRKDGGAVVYEDRDTPSNRVTCPTRRTCEVVVATQEAIPISRANELWKLAQFR